MEVKLLGGMMLEKISSWIAVVAAIAAFSGFFVDTRVQSEVTKIESRLLMVEQQQIQHKELLEELKSMRQEIVALQVGVAVVAEKIKEKD